MQRKIREEQHHQTTETNPDKTAESVLEKAPGTPEEQGAKLDQTILLHDFPKTLEDVQELVELNCCKLNAIYLIEELFNRDIEDEDDNLDPEQARIADEQSVEKEGDHPK